MWQVWNSWKSIRSVSILPLNLKVVGKKWIDLRMNKLHRIRCETFMSHDIQGDIYKESKWQQWFIINTVSVKSDNDKKIVH